MHRRQTIMATVENIYRDSDFAALREALSLWIESAGPCGYYHVGDLDDWVHAHLGVRAARQGLVRYWTEDLAIVGIAICGLFGSAYQAFVRPDRRGSADEREWLLRAEAVTARMIESQPGEDSRAVPITDVFDCDAGRRSSLEGLGYEAYRVWDHINERSVATDLSVVAVPPGFTIRTTAAGETAHVARLRALIFGDIDDDDPLVARAVDFHVQDPETTRTLVAVAPTGEWACLATVHLDVRNHIGLFEPVGTHPRFRRLGLALAVMAEGLRTMAITGMRTARVSHDATNSGAARLYADLGFVRRYTTLGYRAPTDRRRTLVSGRLG